MFNILDDNKMKNYIIFILTISFFISTASAQTAVTLQQDGSEYYVNMPNSGTNTLSLSNANIPSFKVYDYGGKNGNIPPTSKHGYLAVSAPSGYLIRLTGKMSAGYPAYLDVYNGNSSSSQKLLNEKNCPNKDQNGQPIEVNISVLSTSNNMFIDFYQGNIYGIKGYGLDLTVTLVKANTKFNVNMDNYSGGSIVLSQTTAKPLESITLTATPQNGCILSEIQVTDADGFPIVVSGGQWSTSASFKMPGSAVTVKPIFTTKESEAFIKMPISGTTSIDIPSDIKSFKVYDDGGKDGNYSENSNGYLVLNAPENYSLKLTGTIETGNDDPICVYDGTTTNATPLCNGLKGGKWDGNSNVPTDIGTLSSTGRSMMIYFRTNNQGNYTGLDLTVQLVDNRQPYDISVSQASGGSVSTVSQAKTGDIVSLDITTNSRYLLSNITVKGANQNIVSTSGGEWYSDNNTATFTMPASAVTVTPTFTDNWTAEGGLTVNMPKSGNITPIIPSGVSSFKVAYKTKISSYDNLTSTLSITAPTGYIVQLTGRASFSPCRQPNVAIFSVYDGTSTASSALINIKKVNTDSYNNDILLVSTGQSMFISCISEVENYFSGDNFYWNLDLTVNFVKIESHAINVSSVQHGNVVCGMETAEPNEEVTFTVTPDEGYVLKSINVSDADGTISMPAPDAKGFGFDDNAYYAKSDFSFKMRTKDVTITPVFTPVTDFCVRIPKTSQRNFTIPDGTTTFKVYDEDYYVNDNGYLLLTAPQGFKMKVSGRAYIERWSSMLDYLEIFDGATNAATSFGKYWESTNQSDPNYTAQDNPGISVNVTSTGNQLLLYFYSDESAYAQGLDLQVTLIDVRKSLEGFSITIPSQTYNGSALTPVVTVQDGNTTLTEGTDYTVEYSNNTNAGTSAKATITGKGNYTGTVEKNFTINPLVTQNGALTLKEYGTLTTAEIQGDFTTSSEGKSLEISKSRPVDKIIFKRSFTKGIPATIMLPFGFTPDNDNIGSFYTLKSVECKNGEWIATMSDAVTSVKANTPYIFKSAVEELNEMSFEDEDKDDDEEGITLQPTSDIKENPNGDWTLHGVYEKTMLYGNEQINYGFAGKDVKDDGISVGDFIRAGQGVWADPMRCYLTYSGDDTRLKSKAATVLPDRIRVVFPDEVEDEPSDTEIITPVTEITKESGVKVWSYNKLIIIESQSDTDYTIVDLSGRILKTGVTHSTHEEVTLGNNAGIVIVNINGKAFKVNL